MTKDEALKMALEALERYQVKRQDFSTFEDAITTIKEALALTSTQCEVQDELCSSQEPVATLFGTLPVYDTTPTKAPVGRADG